MSGSIESIYAGDLQKGDKLVKSKSDKLMEEEEVVNIETVMESSFWAPLTKEGTLLVDGFLASSYASYPHQASEMLGEGMMRKRRLRNRQPEEFLLL